MRAVKWIFEGAVIKIKDFVANGGNQLVTKYGLSHEDFYEIAPEMTQEKFNGILGNMDTYFNDEFPRICQLNRVGMKFWIKRNFPVPKYAGKDQLRIDYNACLDAHKIRHNENGWSYILDTDAPAQGWKLHVSAKPETTIKIANLLIPYLEGKKIASKMAGSINFFRGLEGTQIGKFITIYTQNDADAVQISHEIDDILSKNTTPDDFIKIPFDAPLGNTGGLFTRYGLFVGIENNPDNLIVLNEEGNHLSDESGPLYVLDDRNGRYKPDFVTWNPFGNMLKEPFIKASP